MQASLILANEAARRLEGGELWFAAGDVVGRKPRLPGIVRLLDRRRRFLAQAFCSPGSRTFLRVITRSDVVIDRAFWRVRIRRAYERRARLAETTDAFRVVHAEADGIPGVVIDKYNEAWAIAITASGAEAIRSDLAEIIERDYAFSGKTRTIIREGDQHFEVDLTSGQKTGAYLDYRAFRLKARELARGRCLDAFCYQGWFACQIASRAAEVLAVDSSGPAIEAAKKNAAINGHGNIMFVKADVFDSLGDCRDQFDFVHLDPPSFAKGRAHLKAAVAGYRKLLALALRVLREGGVLMVSACSHAITERILEETVLGSIAKAGRQGFVLWRGIQDVDHPVLRGHPESLYLKALAVKMN